MRRLERRGWLAVAVVLCALAIPWFLWDDATVVAGLPLWLWWHVGWMLLASLVFRYFARHAWGIGIDDQLGTEDVNANAGADADGTTDGAGDGTLGGDAP